MTTESEELDRWKRIAAYLAECHAANLHEAELSTCSKSRRQRFKGIMDTSAALLKGLELPKRPIVFKSADEMVTAALARLERSSAMIP